MTKENLLYQLQHGSQEEKELSLPELVNHPGLDVVEALFEALRGEVPICLDIEDTLEKIVDDTAIPLLLRYLGDEYWLVRVDAAQYLGQLKAVEGVPGLIQLLNDENSTVRMEAAESLGRIGSREAVSHLIRSLDDINLGVILSTAEALGCIGDSRARGPLRKNLRWLEGSVYIFQDLWDKGIFDDEGIFVRKFFWQSLYLLGDDFYLQLLINILRQGYVNPTAARLTVIAYKAPLHVRCTILRELQNSLARTAPGEATATENLEYAIARIQVHIDEDLKKPRQQQMIALNKWRSRGKKRVTGG